MGKGIEMNINELERVAGIGTEKQPCDWCGSTSWRKDLTVVADVRSDFDSEGHLGYIKTDDRAADYPIKRNAKLCKFCAAAANNIQQR